MLHGKKNFKTCIHRETPALSNLLLAPGVCLPWVSFDQSWRLSKWASQMELVVKNLPANAEEVRDVASIPGLERSPGGGHGNPF